MMSRSSSSSTTRTRCRRMQRRSICAASISPTTVAPAASRRSCASTSLTIRCCGRSARWCTRRDLADERYDAAEARGLDVLLRGLSMIRDDDELLRLSGPLFDGLYEYRKQALLLGREPS